ncbi:MAG: polysaccharide deacetylase family protein [Actinobacteria bacterium]|nr:polysaccharide deacetylase family protein [Actinomycetota bacterium]
MRSGPAILGAALAACCLAACGSDAHVANRRSGATVVLPTAAPPRPPARPKPHQKKAKPPPSRPGARDELITHGPRTGHDVALTFDADMTQAMLAAVRAGRTSVGYDPQIVDELRASHTPATIFMTGLWPTAHPDAARSLASDPLFEIENHSYDHAGWEPPCYGLPLVQGDSAKQDEVQKTTAILTDLTGSAPQYFRFPGGCHTTADVKLVAGAGETPVQWDVVSGDPGQPDPAVVANNVLRGAHPGSIIVMHLVGAPNAPATAAALRTILPGLQQRGLHPVTLNQLLGTG